ASGPLGQNGDYAHAQGRFHSVLKSEQRQPRSSAHPISEEILSKRFRLSQHRKQVSALKSKKNAPAGESGNQRPKRRKERLIRLDDLIPKQDVTGGHQLLFGATDAKQTTNKKGKAILKNIS